VDRWLRISKYPDKAGNLCFLEPFIDILQPNLHSIPLQLLQVRHHAVHGGPTRESQRRGLVEHHGIEDCLHYLGNVGNMGELHRHEEIKIGAKAVEIQGE